MSSSTVAEARPVRTTENSCPRCPRALSMRSPASEMTWSATVVPSSDDRSDTLALERALDVRVTLHVEHDDGQVVVHAQRDGRVVHHLEASVDDLDVRKLVELLRVRVRRRVGVVDPVDLRGLHYTFGADLQGAQGRGGVR